MCVYAFARPRRIIPVTTFAVIRFFPSVRRPGRYISLLAGGRGTSVVLPAVFRPVSYRGWWSPGKTDTQRFQLNKSIISLISFSNVRMNFVDVFDTERRECTVLEPHSFDIQRKITYKKINRSRWHCGFSIANAIEHQTKVFSQLPPSLREWPNECLRSLVRIFFPQLNLNRSDQKWRLRTFFVFVCYSSRLISTNKRNVFRITHARARIYIRYTSHR